MDRQRHGSPQGRSKDFERIRLHATFAPNRHRLRKRRRRGKTQGHENLGDDGFRTVLLNGVAWIAKLEIPKTGVPSKTPDKDALEKVMDDAQAAMKSGK